MIPLTIICILLALIIVVYAYFKWTDKDEDPGKIISDLLIKNSNLKKANDTLKEDLIIKERFIKTIQDKMNEKIKKAGNTSDFDELNKLFGDSEY